MSFNILTLVCVCRCYLFEFFMSSRELLVSVEYRQFSPEEIFNIVRVFFLNLFCWRNVLKNKFFYFNYFSHQRLKFCSIRNFFFNWKLWTFQKCENNSSIKVSITLVENMSRQWKKCCLRNDFSRANPFPCLYYFLLNLLNYLWFRMNRKIHISKKKTKNQEFIK